MFVWAVCAYGPVCGGCRVGEGGCWAEGRTSKGSGGEKMGRERVRDYSLAYLVFESSVLKSKISLMMGPLRF